MRIKVLVYLGLILALCLSALSLSCNNKDELDQVSQQISGKSSSAPPPAGGAESAKPATPAGGSGATPAAPEPAGNGAQTEAKDKNAQAGGEETKSAGEGAKSGEEGKSGEAAKPGDEGTKTGEGAKAEDKGKGEAKKDEKATTEGEAKAGEQAGEGAEAEKELDPISRFETLDPRDIIDMKYEDLKKKQTTPTDPNSEWYNDRIGRVDPLTRVRGEVPDELRPPRAGESDQNQINTYLIAQQATIIVDSLAYTLQCDSVLQVGLEKEAIFILPGSRRVLMKECDSNSFGVGFVEGIPLICTVACAAISTDEVTLSITCYGQNTPTAITKNQVYIPRGLGH